MLVNSHCGDAAAAVLGSLGCRCGAGAKSGDSVVSYLGDPGAIVVSDETGGVKKDACTVGVQRQYTGTAGRSENSQVAVYLTYA